MTYNCDHCGYQEELGVFLNEHWICAVCLEDALELARNMVPVSVKSMLTSHELQTVDGVKNVLVSTTGLVPTHYKKIGKYTVPVYAK